MTYPNSMSYHRAKELGVSGKAVEKWCKAYGIEKPSRGYCTKKARVTFLSDLEAHDED